MATVKDCYGFSHIQIVALRNDLVGEFCKALNDAAKSLGIAPNVPSDALDQSRNLIIGDAARAIGATEWEIRGDTLTLAADGATLAMIPKWHGCLAHNRNHCPDCHTCDCHTS